METRLTPWGWQKGPPEVSGHMLPEGERTEPSGVGKVVSHSGPVVWCDVVWPSGKKLVSEPKTWTLVWGLP